MTEFTIDAELSFAQAIENVSSACPQSILDSLELLDVVYPGDDGRMRAGQLVMHRELVADVAAVFALIAKLGMPIARAIPLGNRKFWNEGGWSDDLSMAANNSSGFNYRVIAGSDRLSTHATGAAVDLNPLWNPMFRGDVTYPPDGSYDVDRPGTFHADHPVVREFERRGWEWGGRWETPLDLHHFQKPLA